jgi:hypothetical protein
VAPRVLVKSYLESLELQAVLGSYAPEALGATPKLLGVLTGFTSMVHKAPAESYCKSGL